MSEEALQPDQLHPDFIPPRLETIHTDARGSMYRVLLPTGQEVLLLHSKAGARRGGYSHTAPEVVTLLSGRMVYHKMSGGRESIQELEPGMVAHNLPDEPHYAEYLEDSWVLEMKYGPGCEVGSWENAEFEPFRAMVREQR